MRLVIAGAAVIAIALGVSRAEAQNIKMDVPAGLVLSTAPAPAPKKALKENKGFFRDLRPGSCKVATPLAPPSSWPARGEPLVAVCRP